MGIPWPVFWESFCKSGCVHLISDHLTSIFVKKISHTKNAGRWFLSGTKCWGLKIVFFQTINSPRKFNKHLPTSWKMTVESQNDPFHFGGEPFCKFSMTVQLLFSKHPKSLNWLQVPPKPQKLPSLSSGYTLEDWDGTYKSTNLGRKMIWTEPSWGHGPAVNLHGCFF